MCRSYEANVTKYTAQLSTFGTAVDYSTQVHVHTCTYINYTCTCVLIPWYVEVHVHVYTCIYMYCTAKIMPSGVPMASREEVYTPLPLHILGGRGVKLEFPITT